MDLQHLRASDGTGEAVLAHVDAPRTIGSTVLVLDNVDNWNSKCVVVTGTPAANGYIAPAGMTIMYGHIDSGDLIIDGYAPGYTDNGNTTNEIAIIKMCTQWTDFLIDLLAVHLQDNGKLKVTSLDDFFKPPELISNFVASGGIVAQSAGLTGTFSNIVFYVAGLRYAVSGVANKVYLASRDTYVDIGSDGTVDYNDVALGAASPALATNHIRIAKVITNGAGITSVKQFGQDDAIQKNLIRPRGSIRPSNKSGGFYVGTFNSPSSAGNTTVTGLPFRPKMVEFMFLYGAGSAYKADGVMDEFGNQFAQSSASRAISSGNVADESGVATDKCIFVYQMSAGGSADLNWRASFVSMNDDGFTINFDTSTSAQAFGFKAYA